MAIELAHWLCVKFRLQVIDWIFELMQTGSVSIERDTEFNSEVMQQILETINIQKPIIESDTRASRQKLTTNQVIHIKLLIKQGLKNSEILNAEAVDHDYTYDTICKYANISAIRNGYIHKKIIVD